MENLTLFCNATPETTEAWVYGVLVWTELVVCPIAAIINVLALIAVGRFGYWPLNLRFVLFNISIINIGFTLQLFFRDFTGHALFSISYIKHIESTFEYHGETELSCLITEGSSSLLVGAYCVVVGPLVLERWTASQKGVSYEDSELGLSCAISLLSNWVVAVSGTIAVMVAILLRNGQVSCFCSLHIGLPMPVWMMFLGSYFIISALSLWTFHLILSKNRSQLASFNLITHSYSLSERFKLKQVIETTIGLTPVVVNIAAAILLAITEYGLVGMAFNEELVYEGILEPWFAFLSRFQKFFLLLAILLHPILLMWKFPRLAKKIPFYPSGVSRSDVTFNGDQVNVSTNDNKIGPTNESGVNQSIEANVQIITSIWDGYAVCKI